MQLTLTRKILILIAIPLLFQAGFLGLLFWIQKAQSEAQEQSVHSKDVITEAELTLRYMIDAETGIRGYVATDVAKFTQPYDEARSKIPEGIRRLRELVKHDANQAAQVGRIEASANESLNWLTETEAWMKQKKRDQAIDRMRTMRGKILMDQLRDDVKKLVDEESRLSVDRGRKVERTRQWINGIMLGGTLTTFALTGALAAFFWRGIVQRFKNVTVNIERLAAEKELLPPLDGNDEIARLDNAFHVMARQLSQSVEKVRRSAREIRDLYDQAPCGYHSVDKDGTIVAINATELQWLGYQREEIVDRRKFSELVAETSHEKYMQVFSRFKEIGSVNNAEFELRRRDGSIVPVLLNASAIRDANGQCVASRSTLFDITERKRAEQTIQVFVDIVNNIPIGVIVYQLDQPYDSLTLRIRSANKIASTLLGVDLGSAIGMKFTEVFPAVTEALVRQICQVITTGQPEIIGELHYGDERVAEQWWLLRVFPLPGDCAGVAFENISQRKRTEDEIRRLNEELEDRVRERTAELADANRDLTQKNQENEMFVYSVSHDLRSPLVNLQGFSKELEKGCSALSVIFSDERLPAELREQGQALLTGKMAKSIGFIQSAVLRLSGIIDALLRLSRAGRVDYRWQWVDLKRIVARIIDAMNGTITEKKATVIAADLPPVWGDPTALEQVFANLIGNALNYLDPKRAGTIEIGFRPEADGSAEALKTYFVKDNGLGIPAMHHQKVFQMFQRVHQEVAKGEGLGLAIVTRIVQRHKGRVWVESKEGVGSTFFISLGAAATDLGAKNVLV